ncbi:MAG: lytic murein transglycosylase [Deltaproteobacteria bacterium]
MRHFAKTIVLALALVACSSPPPVPTVTSGPQAWSLKDAGLTAWIETFKTKALAAGIDATVYDASMRQVGLNTSVIEKDRNQAEFTLTLDDYIGRVASEERIAIGKANFASQSGTLSQIGSTYGVAPETVAAIWGVESAFGTRRGSNRVIEALATLAYEGRRASFYESQLIAALKIIQAGNVDADHMTGSWAGAMGHTQFIPTSYLAYAVDYTGDGKRDIWSEDPSDALASTAAYLKRSGWVSGQPILSEVVLPADFNTKLAGKGTKKLPSEWEALGVKAKRGSLSDVGQASILLPEGAGGVALMIYPNFRAILRYNNADIYAISVGYLSERLAGRLSTYPW